MNKSKFLKKSLAMVLAIMMVVAMIPLSASAAYEPSYSVKPVSLSGGEMKGSGYNWSIEFPYSTTTPKLTVELGNAQDFVTVVNANGSETELVIADGAEVERDAETNEPVPFKFYVSNSDKSDSSAVYTVTWTMADPATAGSVKSAKLDSTYTGKVNETEKTITFTVPFGYKGDKEYVVDFVGCQTASIEDTFEAQVGTYKKAPVAEVISNVTEDGKTDLSYSVYVVEETALKSIKIGDYVGDIKVATKTESDYDKGYETGEIVFTIPADLKADDKGALKLIPSFEVGSDYTSAKLSTDEGPKDLVSGKEFDFAELLDNVNGETLTLTSSSQGENTYTIKFVREGSDTTIDAFTAAGETGTVDGTNLTATISKNADIEHVTLVFEGPIAYSGAAPKIKVVGQAGEGTFNDKGQATISDVDCTKAVKLLVTAADTKTQKYYTLNVTKAESENNDPKITSAKMTVKEDGKDDKEYVASISGTTITFNVPYSTTDATVQKATYTVAKSAFTTTNEDTAKATFTLKDGGFITAKADSNNAVNYQVKFVKDAALTGKSISDLVLTTAENINEVGYNNNETYKVSASGNELKVTVPAGTTLTNLYANFTLSEGAVMYKVPSDGTDPLTGKVEPQFDSETGEKDSSATSDFVKDAKYVIVDETVAYAIATNDTKAASYTQIKNNFGSHIAEYTFKVTETAKSDKARLTSLTANDKKVTSTIGGKDADEVTLTVPYGYVDTTAFFFDFVVSTGATLQYDNNALVSGGEKNWADGKLTDAAINGTTNPNFKVKKSGSDYKLYAYNGSDYSSEVTKLTVVAQDGTTEKEYKIAKIKVAEANTGAAITSLTVNGVKASINGKTITANLPFGTNLGQVKIAITASEMATVSFDGYDEKDPDKLYDLTKDVKITVTSEDKNTTNVYTLTAKVAEQFSDVSTDDWFYDYVMDAVDAGIIVGLGDGRFNPKGNITRGDFALMTVRMLGVDVSSYTTTPFSDVDNNKYYAKAIAYCADKGIIGGVGDGRFAPESYITREQAAKILAEALELDGTTTEKFNDDANIAGWAKDYVYACKAAGIFQGDEKGNFNPKKNITRAEAAKVMVVAQSK